MFFLHGRCYGPSPFLLHCLQRSSIHGKAYAQIRLARRRKDNHSVQKISKRGHTGKALRLYQR